MKKQHLAIFCLLLLYVTTSCQDGSGERDQVDAKKPGRFIAVETKDESFPTDQTERKESEPAERKLEDREVEIIENSLTVKSKGDMTARQIENVKEQYQSLATEYTTNTRELGKFRFHFARVALTENKLLESQDYETIRFFTQELLDSRWGNFKYILKGLQKLRGNIDVTTLDKMTKQLEYQIHYNIRMQNIILVRLPGFIQGLKSQPKTPGTDLMIVDAEENMEKEARDRLKLLDNYMTELKKL